MSDATVLENISAVAGTISAACGIAALSGVLAAPGVACSVGFGLIALGADVLRCRLGDCHPVDIVIDIIGLVPGGMLAGKAGRMLLENAERRIASLKHCGNRLARNGGRDTWVQRLRTFALKLSQIALQRRHGRRGVFSITG